MRTSGNKRDAPGGAGVPEAWEEVGPKADSWCMREVSLERRQWSLSPGPGGPAGLRGNTKFKHYKMFCNVVRAIKIARSPEAT